MAMRKRKRLVGTTGVALLVGGLAGLATSTAKADLNFELKFPDGSKTATVSAAGSVTLDLWANITGTIPGFESVEGSIIGTGSLVGTFAPAGAAKITSPEGDVIGQVMALEPFNGLGAQNGKVQTVGGTMYFGSPDMDVVGQGDFASARSMGMISGSSMKIGSVTFNFAAPAAGQATDVTFAIRKNADGSIPETAALWQEAAAPDGIKDPTNGTITIGAPAQIIFGSGKFPGTKAEVLAANMSHDAGNVEFGPGGSVDLQGNMWQITGDAAARQLMYDQVKAGNLKDTQAGTGMKVGTALLSGVATAKTVWGGDANLDGKVDLSDFLFLAQNFNKPATDWSLGDFTYNGFVDLSDFLALAQNFGKTSAKGGIAAVPEPASLSLLALGGLLATRRIRRK